jgi:hypothetical protein
MTPRRLREPLIEELRYRLRGYERVFLLILGLVAVMAAIGLFATRDYGSRRGGDRRSRSLRRL